MPHKRSTSDLADDMSPNDSESMPPPATAALKTPSPAKRQSHPVRRSVSTAARPDTPGGANLDASTSTASSSSSWPTEAKQRVALLEKKVSRLENELLGQLQYNFRIEQLENEVRVFHLGQTKQNITC